MELLLCCDLVVAARNASFGLPEPKRGLMPDFGGAFRVVRMLPANVAREMLLTGESISAERAERLGFVNVITEPGQALDGAIALAGKICANAPPAVREALSLVNHEVAGDEEPTWGALARRARAAARVGGRARGHHGVLSSAARRWSGADADASRGTAGAQLPAAARRPRFPARPRGNAVGIAQHERLIALLLHLGSRTSGEPPTVTREP